MAGVLVGCAGGAGSADEVGDQPPDFSAAAVIDRDAGSITLPFQAFLLTPDEDRTVMDAGDLAMYRCATGQGVQMPEWQPWAPELGGSRLYGIWLEEWAAKFGYEVPTTPDAQARLAEQEEDVEPYTEAELAVFDECRETDAVTALSPDSVMPNLPVADVLRSAHERAMASEEAEGVLADWDACLHEHGLARVDDAGDLFGVQGATLDITTQNIEIALVDVGCKDATDFIQRIADVDAAYQMPIVDEYRAELTAQRAALDTMVGRAEQYLRENRPVGS